MCLFITNLFTESKVFYQHLFIIVYLFNFISCSAAAQCYVELIVKEADNNVKLIVLDRLIELRDHPAQEKVLQVRLFK